MGGISVVDKTGERLERIWCYAVMRRLENIPYLAGDISKI